MRRWWITRSIKIDHNTCVPGLQTIPLVWLTIAVESNGKHNYSMVMN